MNTMQKQEIFVNTLLVMCNRWESPDLLIDKNELKLDEIIALYI